MGSALSRATDFVARRDTGAFVMTRWSRVLAAGALALVLSSLVDSPARRVRPAAAKALERTYVIRGTVKRLRLDARRLEVIVGVGHALRLVTFEIAPNSSASARGRSISPGQIGPGDVVRVSYKPSPGAGVSATGARVVRIDLVMEAPAEVRP
jgi:hypothetical protein